MASDGRPLGDYIEVAQRIADFREKYPDGSLQAAEPWRLVQAQGWEKNGDMVQQTFVVYVAAAYRTPDDLRPGIGVAWEIFPGRTNFTRGSELQNAETSAWGRAIIAVGASDSKGGIASREEVAARRAERDDGLPVNADGSLSRSRTTDAEKDAAGVMTSGQQAEHTALQPKRERGRTERVSKQCHECGMIGGHHVGCSYHQEDVGDPWVLDANPDGPGTILPKQQRAIHNACTGMDRDKRLATIGDIVGRQVASSNELSYTEAARVLEKLT